MPVDPNPITPGWGDQATNAPTPPEDLICVEAFDSPSYSSDFTNPEIVRKWNIWRTENNYEAFNKLSLTAPAIFDDLDLSSFTLDHTGGGVWTATTNYKQNNRNAETFDTTGGSSHLTQSRQTARFGNNAPNFFGAIGVSDDRIEGVDITIPAFRFTLTRYLPRVFVTQTYKNRLFQLTGKVNSASFQGYAQGECLFLGSTGSRRGREDYEITFNFVCSPNVVNLTIAPGIVVTSKQGWDYLWVYYHNVVDTDAKQIVLRPRAAYVERVYERANLNDLNLGA
jgi:hypothetical protein